MERVDKTGDGRLGRDGCCVKTTVLFCLNRYLILCGDNIKKILDVSSTLKRRCSVDG